MNTDKKNKIIIVSSPSGAGKTTICKFLIKKLNNVDLSISYTTRNKRSNEIDGKDYHFIDKKKFNLLIKNNDFFEYAKIFDNYYGTLKAPVLKLLSQKKDVLFDIDWQGTQQLKNIKNLALVTFFILPPNMHTLKNRLLKRHQGQEKLIQQRMRKFNEEVSHWKEYNYIVINDDLEICYKKILDIIESEKEGISQKQDLSEIVSKVNKLVS